METSYVVLKDELTLSHHANLHAAWLCYTSMKRKPHALRLLDEPHPHPCRQATEVR